MAGDARLDGHFAQLGGFSSVGARRRFAHDRPARVGCGRGAAVGFAGGVVGAAVGVTAGVGSGVVNLSNGAVAMYVAYVYTILRNSGQLFLPPLPNPLKPVEGLVHLFQKHPTFSTPNLPVSISLGSSFSFWPALLISLVFCVLLGLMLAGRGSGGESD